MNVKKQQSQDQLSHKVIVWWLTILTEEMPGHLIICDLLQIMLRWLAQLSTNSSMVDL